MQKKPLVYTPDSPPYQFFEEGNRSQVPVPVLKKAPLQSRAKDICMFEIATRNFSLS
jgi:hypothetical protein